MSGPLVLVIIGVPVVLMVALVVAGIVSERRIERQRAEAYLAFCLPRGFQYLALRQDGQKAYVDVVPIFNRGSDRKWRHEISGRFGGRDFVAFEYEFTVGAGDSSAVIEQAMMKWETARELPGFVLRPETVVDRLRGAVTGSRDISFPDDPAFSQAYFLEGFNQGELRQLFGPDLRQYLVGKKGQNLAAKDRVLFWWRRGKLPPADSLDAFLAEGTEVSQRLLQ